MILDLLVNTIKIYDTRFINCGKREIFNAVKADIVLGTGEDDCGPCEVIIV